MKLALCLEYPIDQPGGTEVLVRELIHGLRPRHQILLVSADSPAAFARSRVAAAVAGHIPWLPNAYTPAAALQLASQLAAAKPDLVHFHLGENHAWKSLRPWKSPLVAAARAGLTVLSTNHGAFSLLSGCCRDEYPLPVKLALLPSAWLGKQITLAHLATEVAVSQNDFHALRRWYPPLRGKFRWLYHSRIRETSPPPENPDRQNIILCAGTIGPRKNQPLLVGAFGRIAKKFPDWQLVFMGREGDPAMMRRIHELIAKHELQKQIQLLGARSDAELQAWYRQSAIFALPSLYEGLGLSLQEAQFNGCACVATCSGGVADLITDGEDGLLVPAGQPAPLAAALEKLMGDAALRECFSRRAPQSVLEKGMIAPKMVAAYEKLYVEILNR
jgi:glycosyltransferase involved in cell wall biosynthesis